MLTPGLCKLGSNNPSCPLDVLDCLRTSLPVCYRTPIALDIQPTPIVSCVYSGVRKICNVSCNLVLSKFTTITLNNLKFQLSDKRDLREGMCVTKIVPSCLKWAPRKSNNNNLNSQRQYQNIYSQHYQGHRSLDEILQSQAKKYQEGNPAKQGNTICTVYVP